MRPDLKARFNVIGLVKLLNKSAHVGFPSSLEISGSLGSLPAGELLVCVLHVLMSVCVSPVLSV